MGLEGPKFRFRSGSFQPLYDRFTPTYLVLFTQWWIGAHPMTITASLIATFPWRGVDINIVISLLIIQTECACGLEPITGLALTVITPELHVHPFLAWAVKGCLIRYSSGVGVRISTP
jgi:hypothetical protein